MTKPRVKPLEWENFDAWTYWAKSEVGTYRVKERNGVWKATLDDDTGALLIYEYTTDGLTPDDFQAAQLAAQADYESRILAALDLTPDPAVLALVEAARLLHDNVVMAFPSLADLGPVSNLRAALAAFDKTD